MRVVSAFELCYEFLNSDKISWEREPGTRSLFWRYIRKFEPFRKYSIDFWFSYRWGKEIGKLLKRGFR